MSIKHYITCILTTLCIATTATAQIGTKGNCCEDYLYVFSIKTNALGLAGTIANIGAEFELTKRLSLDIPVYFSPYNLGKDTRKLRVSMVQPELRYWFQRTGGLSGQFIGLHAHYGYFNVAWDTPKRYQDNTPVVGAGISYGYVTPLAGRWTIGFVAGGGYARLRYNIYENTPVGPKHGELIGTGKKDYWGVTKAEVSISYKFWL